MIHPGNIADVGEEPFYSTLSLWDTFRAAHPLYTILAPEIVPGVVNSFLRYYDAQGFLPIWALGGTDNFGMIGNHSVPVIVDAWMKGFEGLRTEELYAAIHRSLTEDHIKYDWGAYDRCGYFPMDVTTVESVSRTLECGFDDWCAAQMARGLGHDDDAAFFEKRSGYWRNVFDPDYRLMRARDSRGNWRTPFSDIAYEGPGSDNGWGDITEGFTMQYTWTVPHAFEDYMDIAGKKFLRDRLDNMFTIEMSDDIPGAHDIWGRIGGYWHGNEPCHHVLYLYNKLGKPEECQKWVRYVADHFYGNKPDSLSGNDDCGQMSAWYIFNCLGFYPLCPGSNEYELGSPCLPGVTVRLSDGGLLKVRTKNWTPQNVHVKAVYLNGVKLKGTTLRYEDIRGGAELLFVMGK